MNDIKSEAAALFMQLQGLMLRQRMQHMRRGGPFQDSSQGQGRVLSILKMKPEMSQKELGFLLDMSKQSMAELLGKLERNGYIDREPSPEDRRASIIKLTEKGAAAAENLDTEAPAGMLQLFDCLSDEELERLCDYFRRMLAQLKDALGSDDWDRRREWFAMFEQHWQAHGGGRHDRHHPSDRGAPGRRGRPEFFPGEFSGGAPNDEEGGSEYGIFVLAHPDIFRGGVYMSAIEAEFDQLFRQIAPEELHENVFKLVGKDYFLVTAGKAGQHNSMVGSGGGFGTLFRKPAAWCILQATRYTLALMEKEKTYTLSYFPEECRESMLFLGSKSGRDGEKMRETRLTSIQMPSGNMSFAEARLIFECSLTQLTTPESDDFCSQEAKDYIREAYKDPNEHRKYVFGEITRIWVKRTEREEAL